MLLEGIKPLQDMDFAREELDDLSDETYSSVSDNSDLEIDPSETMTEAELKAKRRMLEIKRAVRKRMRGLNTMHTTKVMRPYTMGTTSPCWRRALMEVRSRRSTSRQP